MYETLKKQVTIYFIVLIVLTLIQHPDMLVSPIDRISKLPDAVVFGMGALHPFIFALFGYIFVVILGVLFSLFKKIFIV